MTYNVLETSTYISLKTFSTFPKVYKENVSFIHIGNFNSPDISSDKPCFKYSKKFGIHMPYEEIVSEVCTQNNQPKILWPIIYSFGKAIHNQLLNTDYSGTKIAEDILENKTDSLTYAELVKKQIGFLEEARAQTNRRYSTMKSIATADIIQRQIYLVSHIFDENISTLTQHEKSSLIEEGKRVDFIKGELPDFIISKPPTKPNWPDWLFPPLE